jgi:adenylate kinase family enzyme
LVANGKKRILLLGSVASGKTVLARKLARALSLPIVHVDQIEFNSDLSKKNIDQIRTEIKAAVDRPDWILDGHGPLDLLSAHLKNADIIIFIDLPFWLNVVWLVKRQIKGLFKPRAEMPTGVNEWSWPHFKKMCLTLVKQHRLMNPELLRILSRPENQSKLMHIKTANQLNQAVARVST